MPVDYRQLYEEQQDKCTVLETEITVLRKENHRLKLRDAQLPNSGYEWLANLQCTVKCLRTRIRKFETGEKYAEMRESFKTQIAARDRENRALREELADAHARIITVRNYWAEIFDDLEKETAKELAAKDRELKNMEKRALRAEKQRDDAQDKVTAKIRELYGVKTKLEDEQGKNLKLRAQLNRDYENSSKPSSMKPNRKKITNSREKTGRKPGGQPGHEGHRRKWHAPTSTIEIPAPDKYVSSPDYKPTGKTIRKQVVDIRIVTVVNEYTTPEFINIHTKQRVHAEFPAGMVNEVTYGGNIKAVAFLLNNHCNVSREKVSDFLAAITGDTVRMSTGTINRLPWEFSFKTETVQGKAFADMLCAPAVHIDFSPARVNGKQKQVLVCATPEAVIYFARNSKGHKGIMNTLIEHYLGILIHDHDKTFYSYGSNHQECLQHILRYLKDSMDNEAKLQWNKQMRGLIREMIHFRNCLDPGDKRNPDEIDPATVAGFEKRYDEILNLAKDEYEYEPPSDYYKDGLNLYKRMREYRANHLLFLHDRRVPPTNNLAERMLRIFKRKQAQVMSFRSFDGLDKLCDALGCIATLRAQKQNLYENVADIFSMPTDSNSKLSA